MSNSKIIEKAFGHKLIGTRFLKKMVTKSVLLLPDELINFVTKYLWFVGSFTNGYAFTLKEEELQKGEFLIFLSDELFEEEPSQIHFTILHEIGHAVLGHRNSIGDVQPKSEIRLQERQADEFARKYSE